MVEWFQKKNYNNKKSKIAKKIFATMNRLATIEEIDIFQKI